MLKLLWWFGWLAAVAANGFVVFLFVVFGLAAAAGAPADTFIWLTAFCVGFTFILSSFFMVRQKYLAGIVTTILWFPLEAILGTSYGALFQA